jgi:hypothetical protein
VENLSGNVPWNRQLQFEASGAARLVGEGGPYLKNSLHSEEKREACRERKEK